MEKKKALTVKELAERWSVPVTTIYNRINDGSIPILPLDGSKRILLEVVEEIEYKSGMKTGKMKSIGERKLEKEKREYQERLEEIREEILEINELTAKILKKTRL